ncbi:MAG: LamG-like jellyroll fold domain-containing protein, partial [Solirubrobacteraceae bacterium]
MALLVLLGLAVGAAVAGGSPAVESYDAAVSAAGPVAWFPFADAAGAGSIEDVVGSHSFTASNSGVVLGGQGPFSGSGAGSFSSGAFALLAADPLAGAGVFTVEGWVYWGGGSDGQPVFEFGSGADDYMALTPAASASGDLSFKIVSPSGSASVSAKAPLAARVWSYVVVSESGSGAKHVLSLSVDAGKPVTVKKVSVTPASLGTVTESYLGRSLSGEASFVGSLSNLAFYMKALGEAVVSEHYAALAPVAVEAPQIEGTLREGVPVTGQAGMWSGLEPFAFALQWQACRNGTCTGIEGATGASYTPTHGQVEATLQLAVSATDGAGHAKATSAPSTPVEGKPYNRAVPVISGEATDGAGAKVGEELRVSEGSWWAFPPRSTLAYVWEACKGKKKCSVAEGAGDSPGYRVGEGELGKTLRATVTATNSLGSSSAVSAATAAVVAGPPVNVTSPTLQGEAVEGEKLEATPGTWAGSKTIEYESYTWLRCKQELCPEIPGASGPDATSYTLTSEDVGAQIEVRLEAKNKVGTASATSQPTGEVRPRPTPPRNTEPPLISGEARDGQTLTASTGTWEGTLPISYSYQWQLCITPTNCKTEAGGESYELGHEAVGDTVQVKVTAENAGGETSAVSQPTVAVAAAPPRNTEAPVITGEAGVGQTLTASTGVWEGTPPLTYTYVWEECNSMEVCFDAPEGSGETYTLTSAQAGNTMQVTLTASNAAGKASVTSARTPAVSSSGPVNTAPPQITGVQREGWTLSASTGEWSGAAEIDYEYHWLRCVAGNCQEIPEATGATYVLQSEDVDNSIRVRVTAYDAEGPASSTSAPTGAIAPGTAHAPGLALESEFGASGEGQLHTPVAVAVDAEGNIWVVNAESDRVEEFSPAGQYMKGFGSPGNAPGELEYPLGVAIDDHGDVWVLDTDNRRIEEFTSEGAYIRTVGAEGSGESEVGYAEGIAVAPDGDIWV